MANYFTLTRKGNSEPENLAIVDAELCALNGVPVHDRKYMSMFPGHEAPRGASWFDIYGLQVACGKSLVQCKLDMMKDFTSVFDDVVEDDDFELKYAQRAIRTLDYLIANFTTDAWAR